MIIERNMKQANRVDNGELVIGFLFEMQYDTAVITCIGIEPLSANDYSEIYSDCYYEVDPNTVRDVAVKPNIGENGNIYCPNCKNKIGAFSGRNYCPDCGQRINWNY